MQPPPQDNPLTALITMASGLWVSRALWVAARLRIADAVAGDSTSLAAIAAATGTRPDFLRRLMNALVATGLFRAAGPDSYAHSDMSPFLREDHPLSQRAFIDVVFGGAHYAAWGALDESVRSGVTAFDHVYGEPVFDWYGKHPEEAQLFSGAMDGSTRLLEMALLAVWTPPPFDAAVDVGGSRGTLVAALLARYPAARGILFDLPEVIAASGAGISDSRIAAVGGSFFEAVPEGDLYLLKFILHDWTDAQCETILTNIRAAIRPGGRVAIVENLLPDPLAPDPGYLMDLNMMAMTGGRERTAAEYAALLARTGFEMESVTPTPFPIGVVQAVAV